MGELHQMVTKGGVELLRLLIMIHGQRKALRVLRLASKRLDGPVASKLSWAVLFEVWEKMNGKLIRL